jgi:hypothetical protein
MKISLMFYNLLQQKKNLQRRAELAYLEIKWA